MKESNITLHLFMLNARSINIKNEHGHLTATMVNGDRYLVITANDNESVTVSKLSPEIYAAKWRTRFKDLCFQNDV